jgi:hypothetical protein
MGPAILLSSDPRTPSTLCNDELDAVPLENELICRREWPSLRGRRLADDAIISWVGPRAARRVILLRAKLALDVPPETLQLMESADRSLEGVSDEVRRTLVNAARQGFLVLPEGGG